MNILLFNGGTSQKNTTKLVSKFRDICEVKGHNVILLDGYYKDCTNCQICSKDGVCCFKDDITRVLNTNKIDAVVIGTPVYFFHMSAKAKAFLDRLYPLDKTDLIYGLLCVSGSPFEESGVDLIEESILRACDYCGSKLAGIYNKVTNDEYTGSCTEEDISSMNELVYRMEVLENEIKESK